MEWFSALKVVWSVLASTAKNVMHCTVILETWLLPNEIQFFFAVLALEYRQSFFRVILFTQKTSDAFCFINHRDNHFSKKKHKNTCFFFLKYNDLCRKTDLFLKSPRSFLPGKNLVYQYVVEMTNSYLSGAICFVVI